MPIDSVEVRGLGKRYGLHRALHGVDLDLKAGGVCALLGPNGAGKSTLLGILSSIVRPSGGAVRYLANGEPVEAGEALRRQIGVVAHDSFLYSGLTALENLNFWGQLYQVENLDARSRELLITVGLDEKAWERTAGTYSRGMVQRLSVARTMLHDPSVLLLDEPFTGLDRGGAQALAEALSGAVERGAVVLVITHDLESIAGITTHVAVLRRGKLAFEERRPEGYSFDELKDTYHTHSE
tara:strand:+ start:51603 stop:52319 length:717 start_codon:yes stop_codon:yes gene_type:complete